MAYFGVVLGLKYVYLPFISSLGNRKICGLLKRGPRPAPASNLQIYFTSRFLLLYRYVVCCAPTPRSFFIRDVKVSFNNAPPEYYQQWQQGIKWRYYFGRSFVWPCH